MSALSARVLPRSTSFVQSIPAQVHSTLHRRAIQFFATAGEEQQAHDIANEILAQDPLAGGWAIHMGEQAWMCHAPQLRAA